MTLLGSSKDAAHHASLDTPPLHFECRVLGNLILVDRVSHTDTAASGGPLAGA
jgi:hypothetical protein